MKAPCLASALLLVAAAGCRSPDPVPPQVPSPAAENPPGGAELRLRFRVGDERRYRSLCETSIQVRAGDRSIGGLSSEDVEVTHRVVELTPEGNGVVEVTVDSTALSVEVPGLGSVLTLDTRKPETVAAWKEQCRTDPRAHMLAPLVERVGMKMRIAIAPDGTIADARIVRRSEVKARAIDDPVGIPYVQQVLGSVDPLPRGEVAVGLAGPLDQTYESPAGLHSTKGTRVVTAWEPAGGVATVATVAKILFYPALEDGSGRCSRPGCPGMPLGFLCNDWSVRAEETFDLGRGIRLRSLATYTITGEADSPVAGGPAPTMTMEMKVAVEELP